MSDTDEEAVSVRLTRAELYHRVWETPLVLLAPTLWMSDVGLGKRCVAMKIPLPGRGYWAKKTAGQQVRRTPLPVLGVRASQQHAVAEFRRPVMAPETSEESTSGEVYEREQFEQRPENRIRVRAALVDPHKLVAVTLANYKKAEVRENGQFHAFAGDALALEVSEGALDRALRLFEALIRALEARGFPTTFERIGYKLYTVVHLGIENVTLSVRESKKRSDHVPQPTRPGQRAPMWEPKYDWTPTGLLSIAICPLEQPYHRYTIHESSGARWEEYLNDVIVEIIRVQQEMAARQRAAEDRQAAEIARWQLERQAEVRRAEEEKRIRAFTEVTDQWHECRLLRQYLAAVHEQMARGKSDPAPNVIEWLAWAEGYVERLDPLSNGVLVPAGSGYGGT